VSAQIAQMVSFIEQEAQEKADEIKAKADEEFEIKKLGFVETAKQKLRTEFDRKEKNIEVEKKILQSTTLNKQRLRLLASQEESLEDLKKAAKEALVKLAADKAEYKKLLENLLLESLLELGETNVTVRCRKADVPIVQEVIGPAAEQFKKLKTLPLTAQLDNKEFLAPAPASPDSDAPSCLGGLQVLAAGGTISMANTLDARLDIAVAGLLPQIRTKLFPGRSTIDTDAMM